VFFLHIAYIYKQYVAFYYHFRCIIGKLLVYFGYTKVTIRHRILYV